MRQFGKYAVVFLLGVVVTLFVSKSLQDDPYDMLLHRGPEHELWVSNEPAYLFPMSPFRYRVRYRAICRETGNICSDWQTVASFLLDDPTRASEWKIQDGETSDLAIEFPQRVRVRRTAGGWVSEAF